VLYGTLLKNKIMRHRRLNQGFSTPDPIISPTGPETTEGPTTTPTTTKTSETNGEQKKFPWILLLVGGIATFMVLKK